MAYATYDFYVDSYYGDTLTPENFDKYASRASDYIDRITMGRAAGYVKDDAVTKACCAIADQIFRISEAKTRVAAGEIASEHVGSHSVTYRSYAEIITSLEAELANLAAVYLANTGLLYRGIPYVYASHCHIDFS